MGAAEAGYRGGAKGFTSEVVGLSWGCGSYLFWSEAGGRVLRDWDEAPHSRANVSTRFRGLVGALGDARKALEGVAGAVPSRSNLRSS